MELWSHVPERYGTSSTKTKGCYGGDWAHCGSNIFPAGDFPVCQSSSGVYDINGNAAEHMNLPLDESQMSSRGSQTLGRHGDEGQLVHFRSLPGPRGLVSLAHALWDGTKVMDRESHENYHVGFRCCKSLSC